MNKFKQFFKKVWYKLFTERREKRLKKIEEEIALKKIREEFENNKKGHIERIKKVMYHPKVNFSYDEYERLAHLRDTLRQGIRHVLTVQKYMTKTPFLYEPEIVDIHNERLDRNGKPTIGELKSIDYKISEIKLDKQAIKSKAQLFSQSSINSAKRNELMNKPSYELSLNEIRSLRRDEEINKLEEMERDLKAMNVAKMFKDEPMDDIEFPKDINIDNFPTIKKILGKK